MVLGVLQQPLNKNQMLELAEGARALVREASRKVMHIYRQSESEVWDVQKKDDGSPVTAADLAAHHYLADNLPKLTPGFPVVSEEDPDSDAPPHSSTPFWLIDPLDGTKEFVARNGQFTVNIALIVGSAPVWGAISVPTQDKLYEGGAGLGCRLWRQMHPQVVQTAPASTRQCRALVSRSHLNQRTLDVLQQLEKHFQQIVQIKVGSSLKLCMLAEGEGDLYIRFGPIKKWDLAAGQAVLEGAGGELLLCDGTAIDYRREVRAILPPTLSYGDASANWRQLIDC